MWAWFGLPSIFASLNSQQTLPVFAFSVTSTVPWLDAGAAGDSFVPFRATSNFVPAAPAALDATTTTPASTKVETAAMTRVRMLLLPLEAHTPRTRLPVCLRDQVWLEHALDLGLARAALEAVYDLIALHERQRRHRLDAEVLGELGALVDVDGGHPQAVPLLAGEVRHQALHAPGGAGVGSAEEDEQRAGIFAQDRAVFPCIWPGQTPAAEAGLHSAAECGRRTASACRSASAWRWGPCSRRSWLRGERWP